MSEENKKELHDNFVHLYEYALEKRIVISKGGFAALIGITPQTLSNALSGGAKLTQRIYNKAHAAVMGCQVTQMFEENETPDSSIPAEQQKLIRNICDEDIRAVVAELCDLVNKERESHERIVFALLEAFKNK